MLGAGGWSLPIYIQTLVLSNGLLNGTLPQVRALAALNCAELLGAGLRRRACYLPPARNLCMFDHVALRWVQEWDVGGLKALWIDGNQLSGCTAWARLGVVPE